MVSTPSEARPVIDIQNVEQIYPNGTRALAPVTLSVAPGEFVTLLGPSGCGKSTLLKMIAGLLQPTSGRIQLAGPSLSFVFQEATLMPWADVRRNVRLPLDLAGVARSEADARVDEALTQVGLSTCAAQRPRELSGGMQMRVSIARGLVTQPSLLLMDEPFGALDEITRNKLDDELLQLWRQRGLTVVFVTHSITEAVFLSSRVIVMGARPGRIVEDLRIEQPWPRDDDYRTSAVFNEQVRHLQHSLSLASNNAVEQAS
ncbi:MAG: ABC transporter ATP-binding protein [Aquabacterium sp.]|uniref:ABC transporter ATP-binding protein n=1 Tax=Aquabacterium sp. TaxID=1872578 RepID=UPI0011F6E07D|nr:ABC transporter ATP-binding protein [Aquabacterium sp.]TAK95114.1 MAG: ABC transporter ATP-binding protein [Aquabacterium sp.]